MNRRLRIQRLAHAADLPLPRYETAGAAGMDLVAANPADGPVVLPPMQRTLVPTGLVLQLEPGFEARSRLRFCRGRAAPGLIHDEQLVDLFVSHRASPSARPEGTNEGAGTRAGACFIARTRVVQR